MRVSARVPVEVLNDNLWYAGGGGGEGGFCSNVSSSSPTVS